MTKINLRAPITGGVLFRWYWRVSSTKTPTSSVLRCYKYTLRVRSRSHLCRLNNDFCVRTVMPCHLCRWYVGHHAPFRGMWFVTLYKSLASTSLGSCRLCIIACEAVLMPAPPEPPIVSMATAAILSIVRGCSRSLSPGRHSARNLREAIEAGKNLGCLWDHEPPGALCQTRQVP